MIPVNDQNVKSLLADDDPDPPDEHPTRDATIAVVTTAAAARRVLLLTTIPLQCGITRRLGHFAEPMQRVHAVSLPTSRSVRIHQACNVAGKINTGEDARARDPDKISATLQH
ncbi:hypothetical protein GCM10027414_24790 [Humibacter ginsengiterrae]